MQDKNIIIEEFDFFPLSRKGAIRIYIPENVDIKDMTVRYPVIYMHDAQNLFSKETSAFGMSWNVHTALDNLIKKNAIKNTVVVGIDNAGSMKGRLDEYSPWINDNLSRYKDSLEVNSAGGLGGDYEQFIIEHLIPYIEDKYPVANSKEERAIGGSSMGGLISLYIGLKNQDIFSKILSMSTAIWFAEKEALDFISKVDPAKETKIYLDVGDEETSCASLKEFPQIYIDGQKNIYKTLIKTGFQKKNVKAVFDKNAAHNEIMWAKRFPKAISWLFD